MRNERKLAIVGVGNVGATTAYALAQSRLFSEMVLIDIDRKRAQGEAEDLGHVIPFLAPMEIYAGDYPDLADAALIIITAGAAQKPGETRLDLIHQNLRIFRQIVADICRYNSEAILLVVTNPVDILTEVVRRLSGFPTHRVIGSGTVLDTARLKFLLGRRLGVDMRQVHALIIGEHGDSELPVFSSANISGLDLPHFSHGGKKPLDGADFTELFEKTRDAAYSIIAGKGSTYYGIAEATRRIVTAIWRDEAAILPVSADPCGAYGLTGLSISLPAIIGKEGVRQVLEIPLSDEELARLRQSAAQIEDVLAAIHADMLCQI